jgi:hypothetical protein
MGRDPSVPHSPERESEQWKRSKWSEYYGKGIS